ncbi:MULTISPECIES: glycine betaine/L-proline ABC transporter permease ProW [Pseudomonas]|jgi:glycine betaine/proline transport system permease protein|uniref:Glycine betaine/L-proline ABC transporter permease ProW n=1 Tax=Pseudomonas aphyarum TaxID=2942629 RepID=A0ABT5PGX9_9PSED|nr:MULTISPECIES: glycine betaine/L-proline ABC transporter permease ProW [Pseudomonas]EJM27474.1 ABC-type proline/glycine betaine transport system, permease component [Pseudomonas sp. GM25]MDD0967818.1 glycine betaine/L-proline ABC transporter permease ProW [Pseudomonas aphyarum]MDD1123129.1 glycine betaine/L-proline ABC transporter permease ProW [Pseudomonas aphyarum]MDD1139741.1 glycine betaine/L-proline ABC transporter permease ProW [Pseudomonas aphyarum]QTD35809.1 glycine betaine/L-proline
MSDFNFLDPFQSLNIPLGSWVETALKYLVHNFRDVFRSIRWPVDQVLDGVQWGLLSLPPTVFIIIAGLISWQIGGKRIAIFSVATLTGLGLIGVWNDAMVTLALVLTSLLFCAVIGIPLGILCARSDRTEMVIRPVLDAMQTLPAFVYLVPVVMLFGIGNVPGVIVTIIFSVAPLVRLTNLGIRQVPADKVEAARAFGCTPMQMLMKVQLPLAAPTMMAGLNQTLMLSLSMVVVASMISVGGLGLMVLSGIGRLDMGLASVGGAGLVLLAVFLDRLTQAMGERSSDLATGQRWYESGPVGLVMKLKKKKNVARAVIN